MSQAARRLTAAIAEAWFAVCETPRPAAAATAEETQVFRAMAERGLAAVRAGRRAEGLVAQALCEAFWAGAARPRAWGGLSALQREAFVRVARAFLAEGAKLAAERDAAAARAAAA